MTELQVLQAGPVLEARRETVPVPELGGAVIVRGLMASEVFALEATRSQALRRVREAAVEHQALVRQLQAQHDERVARLGPGAQAPAFKAPEWEQPALDFAELRDYARYTTQLLALAVVNPAGLGIYTAEQWEVASQHHPQVVVRLQAAAERLSGLNAEDVEKNSPARN